MCNKVTDKFCLTLNDTVAFTSSETSTLNDIQGSKDVANIEA